MHFQEMQRKNFLRIAPVDARTQGLSGQTVTSEWRCFLCEKPA